MKHGVLAVTVLLSSAALADIPPANSSQCQGAKAGSTCTTDDGARGTCVTQWVSRLDYSDGVPPKTRQVEMLLCVSTAPATSAVRSAPPFLAAGFVLLLMLTLIAVRLADRGRRSATA